MSLAEVLQLCFRLDPHASATSPSVLAQPLPDSEVPATEGAHLGLLVDAQMVPPAWVGLGGRQGLSPAVREKSSGHKGGGDWFLLFPGASGAAAPDGSARGRPSAVAPGRPTERTRLPGLCKALLLFAS